MFQPDSQLVEKLIKATKKGEINWTNPDYAKCFDAEYNGNQYIICKYFDEEDNECVSFNKIDDLGHIIEPFREYGPDNKLTTVLLDLYKVVQENEDQLALPLM